MGLTRRSRPERLPEKLRTIRVTLGLSQDGMLRKLGLEETMIRSTVSGYERGEREPPLPVLLEYARAANVYVEVLIDDRLDLPDRLPSRKKSEGIQSSRASRKK